MKTLSKLSTIRAELNELFVERAALIDGALCALLSATHVLVIGPPGTAKSMVAEELCQRITGASYFQWLLTKYSVPEDIFGAVSLKSLEQDDYRRVTDHKLPEAHIAFLDEIFKSNSSILNALLSIVNERLFHNGRVRQSVPLITMFGASNEFPAEDELSALFDRFMLRFVVHYIAKDANVRKMLEAGAPAKRTTITLAELNELRDHTAAIEVPAGVISALIELRRDLAAVHIIASDRRWHSALAILRAHAVLEGHTQVSEGDLMVLEHILWTDPEEQGKVREFITRLLARHGVQASVLLNEAREFKQYVHRKWTTDKQRKGALIEAQAKLAKNLAELDQLIYDAARGGRAIAEIEAVHAEVKAIQQSLLP